MDVKRVRAAVTGVIGFFGFLLAFLYVVSALGGGFQGFGLSVLVGVIVASIVYSLYPFLMGAPKKQVQPFAKDKPSAKPPSTTKPVTFEMVCDPGPYNVEAGNPPVKVRLNVQQGNTVVGDVTEKDNYKFNCYVADSANFVKLVNGERGFKPILKSEGKGAHHMNIVIPRDDQWYAVLDAYGQQYVREVSVNLTRPKRN